MEVSLFVYAHLAAKFALLGFIGSHTEQIKDVTLSIGPNEQIENWTPDMALSVTSGKAA